MQMHVMQIFCRSFLFLLKYSGKEEY